MIETGFLKPSAYARWSVCPGSAALEESEAAELKNPPTVHLINETIAPRVAAYKAHGAVEVVPLATIDLAAVTGEARSHALVDAILIAETGENSSALEVWMLERVSFDAMRILGLAAMLKYELLHRFTKIVLVTDGRDSDVTAESLYVFGQAATEAAGMALSLRADASATSHLVAGLPQCEGCLAAHRCPELARTLGLELI